MSGIRHRPSKTKVKTKTRTVTKSAKTKADVTKADKTKIRTAEKHDMVRDKTAVSKQGGPDPSGR